MKLDPLFYYKSKLKALALYKNQFNKLEGHTACVGASNIIQLQTLASSLVEHVKDAVAFVKDPFADASLANTLKSGEDVGSALQVVEYTPSELDFDARDILDLDLLDKLVDDTFRCLVAIKSTQGLSTPRALISLDLILHDVITCALVVFDETEVPDQGMTLTGKVTADGNPIITFRKLDTQKYFTDEERANIKKLEDDKRHAEEAARQRADLLEKSRIYSEKIKEVVANDDLFARFSKRLTDARSIIALHSVVTTCFKDDFFNKFCHGTEFETDGGIANDNFAIAAKVMSTDTETVSFVQPDSYAILNNEEDHSVLPRGTVIRLTIE